MRIGIDARPLSKQRTGIGNYVESLVRLLPELASKHQFFLYSNRPLDPIPVGNNLHVRIDHSFRYCPGAFWLRARGGMLARKDRVDLFWSTYTLLPGKLPRHVVKVITVYDLVWLRFPQTTSRYNLLVQKAWSRADCTKADHIVTISRSTQEDIVSDLGVPESKTCLIYPGVGPQFCSQERARAAAYIARKYGVPPRYMATVGSVEPRKNLTLLVEVVRLLKRRGDLACPLLVAGASGWRSSPIFAQIKKAGLSESDIKFLGYLPDSDLPAFYAGAQVFLFPTLYEGFGLPPLEAMACGTPVIASDARCMPEVLGQAAVLMPPHNATDFADIVVRVLRDESWQTMLQAAGYRRAAMYQWEQSAKLLANLFDTADFNREQELTQPAGAVCGTQTRGVS